MFKIEIFGKIKDYTVDYTKSAASILTGIILLAVSAMFQLHSLWQLNFIFNDYIWKGICVPNYGIQSFVDGPLYNGTISGATDFFLGMNYVGWVLALISVFFVMLGALIYFRANYLEFKDAFNASRA